MTDLAIPHAHLPTMSEEAIRKVTALQRWHLEQPQAPLVTHHLLHAGMYHRTIKLPANMLMTSVLVKRPTTLVLSGDVLVYIGDDEVRLTGYNVIPGSVNRKQAFLSIADTDMTMIFPSVAMSIHEAEHEFTDETEILCSKHNENFVTITKEHPWPEAHR